ncbi:hypothetical protein F5Y08DRAFT_354025 [Xylaria arbuscula]|nr:hypothetical protein F5Y08DRAFT_354025 [Xylaria arbuscula]
MDSAWLMGNAISLTNNIVRTEFDKNLKFDKRDFAAIEFLLHDGYAQFTLERESASSTKVRLPIANQCRRDTPQTPYAPYISASSSASIISYHTTPETTGPTPTHNQENIPSNVPATASLVNDKARPRADYRRHYPELIHPHKQCRKTPNREKRFGVADPLAWDIINRSLTQQRRLSALVDPDGSVILPLKHPSNNNSDITSGTTSQQRALNRFARELEKYADVAGAAGKEPVITPTVSESKASLHTVKPLVPYKDEFLAAGLAVTSAEQGRSVAYSTHGYAAQRKNQPNQHSSRPSHARKKPTTPGDGASSNASPSISCTSSGSYIEFSPPGGHMLHAMDTLVPRKANVKSKHCHRARKRLLSWFIKKPTGKSSNVLTHHFPVRAPQVKDRKARLNDPLATLHEHRRHHHKTHRPAMQSIPEIQLWPKPVPPSKYVTAKKEPCVALSNDHYEQRDQGPHSAQEDPHQHGNFDAKQSLGSFGLRGRRDITRGVLPKPLPEPITTIDEETEINTLTDHSVRDGGLPPTSLKEKPDAGDGAHRRTNGESSVTHQSSIPSLPFAARLAASTASSLQRALDDAYHKVEDDTQQGQAGGLSGKDIVKPELPPIPRRDSRHHAFHHPSLHNLRSSEKKFIYVNRSMPTVEALPSSSKPLPPAPLSVAQVTPKKRSNTKLPQPTRLIPPTAPKPTGKRKNAVAELAKAEEMLRDLDVFLNDYDDADIEDRDVIKGLQVAIHAAADDLYDGYIRHKTGLRIRRFLADLKSFEDITELGPTDQRAREKRAENRRLEGIRNRKGGL